MLVSCTSELAYLHFAVQRVIGGYTTALVQKRDWRWLLDADRLAVEINVPSVCVTNARAVLTTHVLYCHIVVSDERCFWICADAIGANTFVFHLRYTQRQDRLR